MEDPAPQPLQYLAPGSRPLPIAPADSSSFSNDEGPETRRYLYTFLVFWLTMNDKPCPVFSIVQWTTAAIVTVVSLRKIMS